MANTTPPEDPAAANRARVLTVIGALATGITVVGFVAVVGGAVLWLRFNSVAIPADKAVAAVPKNELVSTGLSTLIPYIGLGALVAFLAFLFAPDNLVPTAPTTDVRKRWMGGSSHRPAGPPHAPGAEAHDALSPRAVEALHAADEVALAAEDAASAARLGSVVEAGKHRDRTQSAFQRLEHLSSGARGSLSDAKIDVDELVRDAQLSLDSARAATEKAKEVVVQLCGFP